LKTLALAVFLIALSWCLPPAAIAAGAAAPEERGLLLTREHGCTTCHAASGRRVGPGFAQIAARYRGDPEAAARLPVKIREGGVGTWGRTIMPRQPRVSEADAKVLAEWVLSRPGG
jgi:cytochrome c